MKLQSPAMAAQAIANQLSRNKAARDSGGDNVETIIVRRDPSDPELADDLITVALMTHSYGDKRAENQTARIDIKLAQHPQHGLVIDLNPSIPFDNISRNLPVTVVLTHETNEQEKDDAAIEGLTESLTEKLQNTVTLLGGGHIVEIINIA